MSRSYPAHYHEFLNLARKLHLSFARGRALYAVNRLQNGDWYCRPPFTEPYLRTLCVERLTAIRESTAKRWIKHWNSGGHIRTLRSVAKHNRLRREYYRAYKERRLDVSN